MTKPICIVEGCPNLQRYPSRGWCKRCYMRWWTHGDVTVDKRRASMPTKRPSLADIHWAAGFIEGEASLGHNKTPVRCEVVAVAQVEREPLEKMRDLFGGRIRKSSPRGNQRPYFTWQVSGARGRGLMMTIYSLLHSKRQAQIREALDAKKFLKRPQSQMLFGQSTLPHFELR